MPRLPKFTVGKDKERWYVNISASVSPTGKRKRIYFDRKGGAESEARRLRTAHHNDGADAAKLSPSARLDAHEALKLLPDGVTLVQAARLYLDRKDAVTRSVPLEDVVDAYLAENPDLSDEYESKFRTIKTRYAAEWEGRPVELVTFEDVAASLEWTETQNTRNSYLRHLNVLWEFAIARRLASQNPVKMVKRRKSEKPRRAVFTSSEAEKLMRAAESHEGGVMVGYYALSLFAGLRPVEEASGVVWGDVDFDQGHIYIRPEVAKGDRERYVDLSPNLIAWLKVARHCGDSSYGDSETIAPFPYRDNRSRKRRDAVRDLAGVEWDNDKMRHTFCSHWIKQHNNSGKLCEMAGHSVQVSLKHYRKAVTEKDAAAFWEIYPERT